MSVSAMSSSGSLPDGLLHPVQFLKEELAPYPGRLNLVLRVLLSSAVVTVASLTLGVPLLFLSLVMVLVATQSNLLVSRLVVVLVFVAITFSLGVMILIMKYTYDYPLLRILVCFGLFFCAIFLMRATKMIGPLFWVFAIVVSFVQTLVDLTDNAELLLRLILWLWVVFIYPVGVAAVINTIFLPQEPESQLKKAIHAQLQAIDSHLASLLGSAEVPPPLTLQVVQKGALTLQTLLKFTTMRNKAYHAEQARQLATIATVSSLYAAAAGLPRMPSSPDPELVDAIDDLRKACAALDAAIASNQPFTLPEPLTAKDQDLATVPIKQMQLTLDGLADYGKEPELSAAPAAPPAKKSIFVEDAFTNPIYVQFALKVTLATFLAWVFYTATDWAGIHTIMITTVIIAQAGTGASLRKGVLRLIGCAIGSALAVFVMVFVMPHVDTLMGLLAFTLPVIALASWIMQGSERISYVGLQLLVTFGLAVLMGSSPSINFSEVSARAWGVVLGVVLFTVIQTLIWPESEGQSARRNLADLLVAIRKLLQPSHEVTASAASVDLARQQVAVMTQLEACETMLTRMALEPDVRQSQHEELNVYLQTLLAQARSVMLAVNRLQGELTVHLEHLPVEVRDEVFLVQEEIAAALNNYANELRGDSCQTPAPIPLDWLQRSFANAATAVPETRKAAILNAVENVVRQLSNLPSWAESVPTPTGLNLAQNHG